MKTLIRSTVLMASLATAGLSTHAEGINFYALLDGGMAYTSISGAGTTASRTEFVTGGYAPNFAGITGEKALDKGLTAGFKLEQGFLLNSRADGVSSRFFFGDDSLFNRQANLYVKNSSGTFAVGTQGNIAFNSVLLGDARFGSNFGSSLAAVVITGGLGTIDNGSLSVTTAPMSGFTLAAQVVPQATTATKSGQRFSATYGGKDLSATAATYTNKSIDTTPDGSGTVLGAAYKMGAFTLKGLNVSQKNASTDTLKTNGLGGAYALTAETTLDFGVYKSTKTSYSMNTTAVGAQYKFLKDLTLYGQYASVKNNGTLATPYNFAPPTIISGNVTAGQTATTINVGFLYSFF